MNANNPNAFSVERNGMAIAHRVRTLSIPKLVISSAHLSFGVKFAKLRSIGTLDATICTVVNVATIFATFVGVLKTCVFVMLFQSETNRFATSLRHSS